MVKRSLILLLLSSVLVLTFLPNVPVMTKPSFAPHEDPTEAESSIDSFSLLMYYSDVFMQMSQGQYENASMLVRSLKFAYAPEELRYIVQRYNDLMLELTQILNDTENLLREASALLEVYRLEEASMVLNSTGLLLGRADILLRDVEEATGTLSNRLRVFASPTGSKARLAYDRLRSMLQRLKLLAEEYEKLLKTLRGEASEIQMMQLAPTEITLNLNTSSVLVGGFIRASGNLLSEGKGLAKRTVTILLDGTPVAESVTSLDGSYSSAVTIPYRYVNMSSFEALYSPKGDDRGIYLASKSPKVPIKIIFHRTWTTVFVPEKAYPGLPITVEGEATVEGGVPARLRDFKIFLDNIPLAENHTDLRGHFEAEIVISPRTLVGKHKLTLNIEPKAVHAGVTYQEELNVVKATSEMSLQVPSVLLLPTSVYVKGYVHSSFGPLKGALIRLELAESSITVKTVEEGRFDAAVYMPLNLFPSGFQELRVSVEPAEPWNAPVQTTKTILVMNPVNISLMSATFLSITVTLYTNLRKTKPTEEAALTAPIIQSKPEVQSVEARESQSTAKPKDVRGRVIEAYLKAVEKIVEVLGIPMAPYMTLREFLSAVKPNLKDATDYFTDLTLLAERVLYSPYFPQEDEASEVEGSVEKIMKSMKVGSP